MSRTLRAARIGKLGALSFADDIIHPSEERLIEVVF
jgi:hypothetical protein